MEPEGELTYHARMCEGGSCIFLVPQKAQIYFVDQGRILKGDSPYRNQLGESFSIKKSAKWQKFEMSEETGGAQIYANLRKAYLELKIPQLILQGRTNAEKVLSRHRY